MALTSKALKYSGLIVLSFLIATVFSCGTNPSMDDAPPIEEEEKDPWNLIFEDEFDGDLSLWNAWNSGAFNEEIQLYKPEQLKIENGILRIEAQREKVTGNAHPWDNTQKEFEYVSGRIESKDFFGPQDTDGKREYRFMARVKLPAGNGMWPAFWTYGDPWPTAGEIDIFEARGSAPKKFQSNLFYGTQENVNINRHTEVEYKAESDLTTDFHVYEMIWKSDSIQIILDDELLHTYAANSDNNVDKMFGKEHRIVLNTAVGGLFFNYGNSESFAEQSTYEIDWVRVYRK
ncbi:MAG: glycoside hydrolase family 16 protein [Bacteroidia bacterium]